jgi:ABC-type branched-subunit amino acid transport system substrate-binding protein
MNRIKAGLCVLALLTAGVSVQAQLLIGQTAGFTGQVGAGVKETTDGARLYIDAVNAKGGVNGQKIELVSLDDKFDPKLAAENARKLIEDDGVLAMFLTRGTPHTEGMIPLLDKHGVALVAPSTGAMVLHQPVVRHIFNVRATYQREAEKAIAHLHTIGITRIAVLYADDSFGADGLAGAQKGMDKAGIKAVALEKFDRARPDFSKIGPKVAKLEPQTVMMVASGTAVVDAIKALRAAGSGAQIVTLSNNASDGFVKSLGSNARGVIVTQVFPYERSIAFPIVKEAQELARAKSLGDVSPAMLEGFAGAKVLVEALRRAGPKPSRDRIQAALEGLRKFDLGGLDITYGPDDHTGLDFADLAIIGNDGKFKR